MHAAYSSVSVYATRFRSFRARSTMLPACIRTGAPIVYALQRANLSAGRILLDYWRVCLLVESKSRNTYDYCTIRLVYDYEYRRRKTGGQARKGDRSRREAGSARPLLDAKIYGLWTGQYGQVSVFRVLDTTKYEVRTIQHTIFTTTSNSKEHFHMPRASTQVWLESMTLTRNISRPLEYR